MHFLSLFLLYLSTFSIIPLCDIDRLHTIKTMKVVVTFS